MSDEIHFTPGPLIADLQLITVRSALPAPHEYKQYG